MSLIEQILRGIKLAPLFEDMLLVHMTAQESPIQLIYCHSDDIVLVKVFNGIANDPYIHVKYDRDFEKLDRSTFIQILEFLEKEKVNPMDDSFQWHHDMKETFFNLQEECTRALEVTSNV